MRPLSNDLRKRVIDAVEGGMSRRAAAERFGIAVSTAIRWVRRWRAVGSDQPRPQGGDKRSYHVEAHAPEILALVEDDKDITLAEIAAHLEDRHGCRFASTTIWRLLDRHGMTFKKNRARRRTAKT
jgi:transposase